MVQRLENLPCCVGSIESWRHPLIQVKLLEIIYGIRQKSEGCGDKIGVSAL